MEKALSGSWVTWIHTLVLPLTCCVTLDQSLAFSSLCISHRHLHCQGL